MFVALICPSDHVRDKVTSNRQEDRRVSAGRTKNFLDDLSNSGPVVRRYSEGKATGPPEGH